MRPIPFIKFMNISLYHSARSFVPCQKNLKVSFIQSRVLPVTMEHFRQKNKKCCFLRPVVSEANLTKWRWHFICLAKDERTSSKVRSARKQEDCTKLSFLTTSTSMKFSWNCITDKNSWYLHYAHFKVLHSSTKHCQEFSTFVLLRLDDRSLLKILWNSLKFSSHYRWETLQQRNTAKDVLKRRNPNKKFRLC